jgi:ribonuclease P protein component
MNDNASKNRLRKIERICSKKHIDLLFQKGKSKWEGCLRITYLYSDELSGTPVQVMFSAPKKQFRRAVDRNLLKRRMREAYRMNKHELVEKVSLGNNNLFIAFLYVGKEVETYQVIVSDLQNLLHNIPME